MVKVVKGSPRLKERGLKPRLLVEEMSKNTCGCVLKLPWRHSEQNVFGGNHKRLVRGDTGDWGEAMTL